MKSQTVFVGLSGGVDSSTTAYLLKQAGYRVVGVYMKNWVQDIGNYRCPWYDDYLSAKRTAAFLDLEFLVFDFQKQYKQLVVDYMIGEYGRGNTPNPDIKCNEEVKFKLFLEACLETGADLIATGHYARIKDSRLCRAADESKDQTYFLYRIEPNILGRVLFPLGDYLKSQTRDLALKAGLPSALRPESMGICFVGQIGLADFLKHHITTESGQIIDEERGVVGRHSGAVFYTLGQRHGLNIGGGLPYYVVGKDMVKNEVYVSRNIENPELWSEELHLKDTRWLVEPKAGQSYDLRIRHGGEFFQASLGNFDNSRQTAVLSSDKPVKAAATGQSAVLYDTEAVIGGGIISPKPAK